jgi:hypothetical protein
MTSDPIYNLSMLPDSDVAGFALGVHGVLDTFTDGGLGIALLWPSISPATSRR